MAKRQTVFLVCGLPCSGKTTLARRLEVEKGAVRLTLDEWMLRLFGLPFDHPDYPKNASKVKDLLWSLAGQLIRSGCNVVLDLSLWSPQLRSEWRKKVEAIDADHVLYYLNVDIGELTKRLESRNFADEPMVHKIPVEELLRFSKLFMPPSPNEGLQIKVIRDSAKDES
jgi:predicted kinase